jgi:hypothetical protein
VTLCYLSFFCLNKVSVHPLKAVNKIHPIIWVLYKTNSRILHS